MSDEHEQSSNEEPAGDAPEGAVSPADLQDDPGAPDKGVQWQAPQRAQHAAESGAAAAAEDASSDD